MSLHLSPTGWSDCRSILTDWWLPLKDIACAILCGLFAAAVNCQRALSVTGGIVTAFSVASPVHFATVRPFLEFPQAFRQLKDFMLRR